MDVRQNKSVLWAYKNKLLGFTSHRKKRENKIKKEIQRGTREKNSEDPFELFVSLHNIRYTYYKETDKILGNTFGMVRNLDMPLIRGPLHKYCQPRLNKGASPWPEGRVQFARSY